MEPSVSASLCQDQITALKDENVMATMCVWSHLLHPVPELAQGLQPLTRGGQLQQGVAAHHQVILDSRNVLRRGFFRKCIQLLSVIILSPAFAV